MKGTGTFLGVILVASFVMGLLYFGVASFTWQFRNPKANPVTTITFFSDMIQFNKLETFQANKGGNNE